MTDSDPPLPRVPEDPESLRRLRREALRRMEEDEHRLAAVVYGGPPIEPERREPERPSAATVYGGPTMGGGGSVTRRWTLKRILILLAALLAGLTALFFGTKKISAPVYGGPPILPDPGPKPGPDPGPKRDNPVYGGPVPPGPRVDYRQKSKPVTPPRNGGSSAAVYGGPPPTPPVKPQ